MNEALLPFVDTVFKNDVPILLENGEYLPTLYILQKGKGLLYNLAPSDANDLREMAKSALEQTPDTDAYALAYAPEGSSNGTRMALFTVEFCGRNDSEAAVLAVACDLDAKKMVSDCVQRPSADSLFSRPQNGLCS